MKHDDGYGISGGFFSSRGRPVVLLVDMQDGLVRTPEQLALVPRQIRLLRACRESGFAVVYLELEGAVYGRTNYRLLDVIRDFPEPSRRRVGKRGRNGFEGTELEDVLLGFSANGLLVTGISSCGCVYETVREALGRGFPVLTGPELIAPHCAGYVPDRGKRCACCPDRVRWFREHTEYLPLRQIMAG